MRIGSLRANREHLAGGDYTNVSRRMQLLLSTIREFSVAMFTVSGAIRFAQTRCLSMLGRESRR